MGRLQTQIEQFLPLVQRVIQQTRSRVLEGRQVSARDKVLSLFAPQTRLIPRHNGATTVEFGRQVMLSEVRVGFSRASRCWPMGNRIATRHYLPSSSSEGLWARPTSGDWGLRGPHQSGGGTGARYGSPPRGDSAERTYDTGAADARAESGLASPLSLAGRLRGRIGNLRRQFGLARCAYHGEVGLQRWIGWGSWLAICDRSAGSGA